MKLLVTGANGQVGRELVELCKKQNIDVVALTRERLDITNYQNVFTEVKKSNATLVVNAAAYTAVDKAETEKVIVWSINQNGVENIAKACLETGTPLLHLSTDYVFDGEKQTPYVETDAVNPLCEYGKSKLAGEQVIQALLTDYYILRTSWVFGQFGNNFVKTMIRLAKTGNPLNVVDDQIGTPTPALMITKAIISIASKLNQQSVHAVPFGIYHIGGLPEVSWYEFAVSIIEEANKIGLCEKVGVQAITTKEYPTLASRPKNSCLNSDKLSKTVGEYHSNWRPYLQDVLVSLG